MAHPTAAQTPHTRQISRRDFLRYSLCMPVLIQSALQFPPQLPHDTPRANPTPMLNGVLSYPEYLHAMATYISKHGLTTFVEDFKALLLNTARDCIRDDGQWVIPSRFYQDYFFARDSFWVLAALRDPQLSALAVDKFRAFQANTLDGHSATALYKYGAPVAQGLTVPNSGARDEESTLMYVLHNYLLKTLGGDVDEQSLRKAYGFIQSHLRNGRYVTTGEVRSAAATGGTNQVGTFHYWADTYRPAGKPVATPVVMAYNQGLLCVALRCLELMGIPINPKTRQLAEYQYANMVNPKDRLSLPQRESAAVMDVSALVGEALSLYFFDAPLLSSQRVNATLNRLARMTYPDRTFLGFKVISDFSGAYRPASEFIYNILNTPGNYQNGGSWLLYDALALYCGIRHQVPIAQLLFFQRLSSEVRGARSSHEFISTHPRSLGYTSADRNGYGWNAFVYRLLPSDVKAIRGGYSMHLQ